MEAQTDGDQMAICIELLRRILKLSPGATVEDINHALLAIERLPGKVTLSAFSFSARASEREDTANLVCRNLRISRAAYERYA